MDTTQQDTQEPDNENCNSTQIGNRDESGCLGQPKPEVTPSNTNSGDKGSGDTSKGQGKESLEDLVGTLFQQIRSSDWLEKNTTEKWQADNPQVAKDYMDELKKS